MATGRLSLSTIKRYCRDSRELLSMWHRGNNVKSGNHEALAAGGLLEQGSWGPSSLTGFRMELDTFMNGITQWGCL